jgi:hypothetical protein
MPTAEYAEHQAILDMVVKEKKDAMVKEQAAKAQAEVMAPVMDAVAAMGHNVAQLTSSLSQVVHKMNHSSLASPSKRARQTFEINEEEVTGGDTGSVSVADFNAVCQELAMTKRASKLMFDKFSSVQAEIDLLKRANAERAESELLTAIIAVNNKSKKALPSEADSVMIRSLPKGVAQVAAAAIAAKKELVVADVAKPLQKMVVQDLQLAWAAVTDEEFPEAGNKASKVESLAELIIQELDRILGNA